MGTKQRVEVSMGNNDIETDLGVTDVLSHIIFLQYARQLGSVCDRTIYPYLTPTLIDIEEVSK